MNAVVIGAGAAGLICAGGLAEKGHEVVLIEKNDKVGKKLFITGKGRCNLTNSCDAREFLSNVVSNPKFLNSAIYGFTPSDCMDFFSSLGVKLKVERGNRVFPATDKSNDIVKALEKYVRSNGADIRFNEKAVAIETKDGKVVSVKTDKADYPCDIAVLATGGATYSSTGSTGDGYKIAKALGHTVTDISPALVPLLAKGVDGLQGLSLKNVTAGIVVGGKTVASEFGEMLFTHNGVSGPIILTLSSLAGKYCDKNGVFGKGTLLSIDLKPALDDATLDARIQREIAAAPKAAVKTLLFNLMPRSLAPKVLAQARIAEETKAGTLSAKHRSEIVRAVKSLTFALTAKDRIDFGIITQGGVDVKEISPKDMSSKKVSGLYVVGELLDVDALTGGFNLQIAFATAMAVVRAL